VLVAAWKAQRQHGWGWRGGLAAGRGARSPTSNWYCAECARACARPASWTAGRAWRSRFSPSSFGRVCRRALWPAIAV